jgi:NADH:ubiquinone oxidoreductase subunit B-like Fe-S oxidoreductase
MRQALQRAYDATPAPKWVVAVGDCTVDGGIFAGRYAIAQRVGAVVPVDLHIRGCPPTPTQLFAGLLTLLMSSAGQGRPNPRPGWVLFSGPIPERGICQRRNVAAAR